VGKDGGETSIGSAGGASDEFAPESTGRLRCLDGISPAALKGLRDGSSATLFMIGREGGAATKILAKEVISGCLTTGQ
jgi:hypothetical protein